MNTPGTSLQGRPPGSISLCDSLLREATWSAKGPSQVLACTLGRVAWSTVPLMALVDAQLLEPVEHSNPFPAGQSIPSWKAEALSSDQTAPAALLRPSGCCWALTHANQQATLPTYRQSLWSQMPSVWHLCVCPGQSGDHF